MDKIKIIFWIIAGVLYLVSRAYKSEKNKENSKRMSKKPVSKSKIEDILRDIQREIDVKPIETPQHNKPKTNDVRKQKEIYKQPQFEKVVEGKRYNSTEKVQHFKNTEPHLENIKNENKVEELTVNENIIFEDFDAKKAIIYSEIFKRKEW